MEFNFVYPGTKTGDLFEAIRKASIDQRAILLEQFIKKIKKITT